MPRAGEDPKDWELATKEIVREDPKPIIGDTICGCCGEKYKNGEIYRNPFASANGNDYGMGKYCILTGVEDWVNGSHGETPENSSIDDKVFWLEELEKSMTGSKNDDLCIRL